MQQYTLTQLAHELGAELSGEGDFIIDKIATLSLASKTDLAFLSDKKYRPQLEQTNAGAVILTDKDAAYFSGNKLIVNNPYVAYAKVAQLIDTTPNVASYGVHSSAVIDSSVSLGNNVSVGANVVIEAGATIADNVQIGAHCFIGQNSSIGEGCKLWANVTVYHEVQLGKLCTVHSGAVVGSDGFGFANESGRWIKIPQVGTVIVGEAVEIGANTCIDRGAIGDTMIGDNVILDNMVHIAHNVEIGQSTAMAACSVVAGSTKIGKHCQIAGLVGINGHVEICDGVILTGMTMITKSITSAGVYSSGVPHSSNKEWRRNMAHLRNLSDFKLRLKALESVCERLDQTNN